MATNKDTVRRWIAALGAGDAKAFCAAMTDDVIVETMGTTVLAGTRGFDEAVQLLTLLGQFTKAGIDFTITEMTAEDDRVAAEFHGNCQMVDGTLYNYVYHLHFYLHGGKVCRVKEYMDTKPADAVVAPLLAQSPAAVETALA